MSVRHVYARDGEYVAVHRHHGGYVGSSCSRSADGDGWLIVIGVLLVAGVIYLLRYIILAAAILIASGWLIWRFRHPLWRLSKWAAGFAWKIISLGGRKIRHFTECHRIGRLASTVAFLQSVTMARYSCRIPFAPASRQYAFSLTANELIRNAAGVENLRCFLRDKFEKCSAMRYVIGQ